jgi:hypothetical protein
MEAVTGDAMDADVADVGLDIADAMAELNFSMSVMSETKQESQVAWKSSKFTSTCHGFASRQLAHTLMQLCELAPSAARLIELSPRNENNRQESALPQGKTRSSTATHASTKTEMLLPLCHPLLHVTRTPSSMILDLHSTTRRLLAPSPPDHPLFSKLNTGRTSSTACVKCTSILGRDTSSSILGYAPGLTSVPDGPATFALCEARFPVVI